MNTSTSTSTPTTYQSLMREAIDLMNNFKLHEAEALFLLATKNFPHEAQAWMGLAMTSYDLLKVEGAIEAFRQIGQSAGDWLLSERSVCHMHLVVGNYQVGWQGYMKRERAILPKEIPLLSPSNVKSFKHLLILPEQGFGDMLQFVRFFVHLRKSFPEQLITFICPKPFLRLLQPYCDSIGVSLIEQDSNQTKTPAHKDGLVYIHLCSLAAFYNCSMRDVGLPAELNFSYDKSRSAEIRESALKGSSRPLIGFCWAGKPTYSKDYRRSLSAEIALQLVDDLPDCEFLSLTQPIEEQKEGYAPLIDHPRIHSDNMSNIVDFYDTASSIMACDMVVSVDTACVHLAASLRKPSYLMCAFAPDWRWKLGRNDSPWYDSLTIFRQRRLGNWDNVLQDIPNKLMYDLKRLNR